jgi:hypothetical protein
MKRHSILVLLILFLGPQLFSLDYSSEFKQAEAIFNSANQPQSIPMFEKLILALESEAKTRDLTQEQRLLIAKSYDLLGQAHFNNDEEADAGTSFLKLIEWNPDYKMNEDLVSAKIVALFEETKRDNLAMLTIRTNPEGANVYLDGRNIGPTNFENQSVVKGKHKLEIRLDGYRPVSREIDIPLGAMQEITVQLAKSPSS